VSTTLATLQQRLQTMIGDKGGEYTGSYSDAINNAARELFPTLYRNLVNETLITGNILPNSHFEDWASSSYPDRYNKVNATCAETTSAGLVRDGTSSSLVSPSAADGYMFITSGNTSDAGYPRLLDLMGKTIDIAVWAYPSTADDVFMDVYYIESDGTATTVSTTTSAIVTQFSLLSRTGISIPDGIKEIQFRFRVHTNGETCYFDNARVMGKAVYDYMLPQDFQDGEVRQVWLQTTGYSDDPCDDLHPRFGEELFGWSIIDDGTDKYLRLPYLTSGRKLKLIGTSPLENNLSSSTNTMSIDGERVNLLLSYAAYLLYEMERGIASPQSVEQYDRAIAYWLAKYEMLKPRLRMTKPATVIRWS
jgi:hypothetical protein